MGKKAWTKGILDVCCGPVSCDQNSWHKSFSISPVYEKLAVTVLF